MVQSFILFLYAIIIANVLDQNVYWQKDIYIKLRDLWLILVSQSWLKTTRVSLRSDTPIEVQEKWLKTLFRVLVMIGYFARVYQKLTGEHSS